jgi:hypothetical protein
MKKNRSNHQIITIHKNLLGEPLHRNFLSLQAEFGIAQRGGVYHSGFNLKQANTLVDERIFLNPSERKQLIFSEPIFNN